MKSLRKLLDCSLVVALVCGLAAGARMSLLDFPEAQALLADAEVSAAQVAGCRRHLERFLQR